MSTIKNTYELFYNSFHWFEFSTFLLFTKYPKPTSEQSNCIQNPYQICKCQKQTDPNPPPPEKAR